MTTSANAALATIPIVNVADGGPVRHATDGRLRARALRADCVSWLPKGAAALLPAMDAATRRWLRHSPSPYLSEVEAIAAAVGGPGIWFLNGCYQWGCTALAREDDGAPWLVRTLDWPFPGLGRRLEITRMRGIAGDFDNATWPGYVGILTASAPSRFAAAINQGPMWRRTRRPMLRSYDIALNALRTWRVRHIPPDHLLRSVFETARTYGEARHRLETTPVARPVIYTLVGCKTGERCVIERREESFETRTEDTAAANNWLRASPSWEARVSSEVFLTRTYDEAQARNSRRRAQIAAWAREFASGDFEWVEAPILNSNTRLAVEMCPAVGTLRAVGYELGPGSELPQRATHTCELTPVPA